MSASILDCETISQDPAVILANLPPWDEQEARQRVPKNYKKEEAISGWLDDDKANWNKDAIEKAALNPETAIVAVVGFWKNGKVEQLVLGSSEWTKEINELESDPHWEFPTESELIEHAFMRLSEGSAYQWMTADRDGKLQPPGMDHCVLGWNLHGYDLMMLIRRAWILGVPVPRTIFNPLSRYHFPERFVDMMQVWKAGNFKSPHQSLNHALKAVGLPEKGDGKDFGKLWASDRSKALEYNANELRVAAELYKRMGAL